MPGTKHDAGCDLWLRYILNDGTLNTSGLTGTQHYIGLIDTASVNYESTAFNTAGVELLTADEDELTQRVALPAFADWTIGDESGAGVGRQATNDNIISMVTSASSTYTIYGWFLTDTASLSADGNIKYACELVTPVAVGLNEIIQFDVGSLKIVEN